MSEMAHSCRCSASSGCGLRAWRLPRGTEARFREQGVPREPAGTYVTLLSSPQKPHGITSAPAVQMQVVRGHRRLRPMGRSIRVSL